jgi:hypothetical protein
VNEQRLVDSVRRYLNLSIQVVDPATAERLRVARAAALERFPKGDTLWPLKMTGHGAIAGHGTRAWGARRWVPLLVAVAVVTGVTFWHHVQQGPEPGEIDALLLADDLPVGAYLDHRFDAWLKRAQQ